jgi:hypothetical protein
MTLVIVQKPNSIWPPYPDPGVGSHQKSKGFKPTPVHPHYTEKRSTHLVPGFSGEFRFFLGFIPLLWQNYRKTRGPRAWRSADRSRQGKKPEFEMSSPVPITQYMDMHDYTLP